MELKITAVIKVPFDWSNDVDPSIGTQNGNIRTYSSEDVEAILECINTAIAKKLNELYKKEIAAPEEYYQYDVSIFGKPHAGIFGSVSVNLSKWDNIAGIELIIPSHVPCRVFPVPVNGVPVRFEYLV